jgi:hypothetical protein
MRSGRSGSRSCKDTRRPRAAAPPPPRRRLRCRRQQPRHLLQLTGRLHHLRRRQLWGHFRQRLRRQQWDRRRQACTRVRQRRRPQRRLQATPWQQLHRRRRARVRQTSCCNIVSAQQKCQWGCEVPEVALARTRGSVVRGCPNGTACTSCKHRRHDCLSRGGVCSRMLVERCGLRGELH